MLGKFFDKILHENEDEVDSINHERLLKKYEPKNKVKNFSWKKHLDVLEKAIKEAIKLPLAKRSENKYLR